MFISQTYHLTITISQLQTCADIVEHGDMKRSEAYNAEE